MTSKAVLTGVFMLFVLAALTGCGGGGGGGGGAPPAGGTTSYTVGVTVIGLTGSVVLQNNGGDNLTVAANGPFTFAARVANGSPYSVTVLTQPAGQTCSVANGSGTITANVTNVTVTCATGTYTIGGAVSGLNGSVVLQNNGGNNLTVSANGLFTFSTALNNGAAYAVTVLTQPTGYICSVGNGAGTVSGANITNITVFCTAPTVAAVAAGGDHSLALKADGTVWAWGGNGFGQLGAGAGGSSPTPVQVSGLTNVTQIAAGEFHSIALKADGTVWAWGLGTVGELGNGAGASSPTPVQVRDLTNVIRIAAGLRHNLAARANGTVWAWGLNSNGQLGDESSTHRSVPVHARINIACVPPAPCAGVEAHQLAAGATHSLAELGATVFGWGSNSFGQIGSGAVIPDGSNRPIEIRALHDSQFPQFAAGSNFSMALKADGTILWWGVLATSTPTRPNTLSGVAQIAAGSNYQLALKTDGTVWGWGNNDWGQVTGNYTIVPSTLPVQAGSINSGTFLSGVQRIGAGAAAIHTLVLKQDGTVWAFGHDGNCKLGRGCTGSQYSRDPVQVPGLLLFPPPMPNPLLVSL